MTRHKILWTEIAIGSLREIVKYIEEDNPTAARKQAQMIKRAVLRLAQFPKSGKVFEPVPGLREMVVSKYRIFYEVQPGSVVILKVVHGSRNIERVLGLEHNES